MALDFSKVLLTTGDVLRCRERTYVVLSISFYDPTDRSHRVLAISETGQIESVRANRALWTYRWTIL